ncbi:MAG: 3-oxoacyl-ACP synthase [Candidatus Thorarchaeota archaeon]
MTRAGINAGLVSTGVYLPKHRHTAAYISTQTGIPEDILITKFGLKSKTVGGPEDGPIRMGTRASKTALAKAPNMDAEDIDVVLWTGESFIERPMQVAGVKLAYDIGAVNAWALDLSARCATLMGGFRIAKALMAAEPEVKTILLASGYQNCDLINYKNERSRFMFSLAASGVAVIIQKDYPQNKILETAIITDGAFADDVYCPAGGTAMPITCEAIEKDLQYLDVPDPSGMKARLDKLSMENFIRVIKEASNRSGYTIKDIDYLALLHMKRSAFTYVLRELGLTMDQTTYFEEWGHMGQNDAIVSIEEGIRTGKIKAGDLVCLAAAGIGYTWSSTCIKWG